MSQLPHADPAATMPSAPLIEVDRLCVDFDGPSGSVRAVDSVSFAIARGEKFALVGESGSGKTVTAQAMLRLLSDARVSGQVRFAGRDLASLSEPELRSVRGRHIAMIFQEPMSALNPLYSVGEQIGETLTLHEGMSRAQARARAIELLDLTGITEPQRRIDSYPHELSGGQRQRAMIAMALACSPELLIADEPTTALDVTIQRQIIDLLDELQRQIGMSVLLISHDLPLVRRFAQRVGVMRQGRLVEIAPTTQLFDDPQDPYTRRLIDSHPRRTIQPIAADAPELLSGRGVGCRFWIKSGWFGRKPFDAVKEVDVTLSQGETLGIVGESGSGKTTLGMTLLRLAAGDPIGEIRFMGERIDTAAQSELRRLRSRMQVVFQDPYNALSPRMTIEQIVVAKEWPCINPSSRLALATVARPIAAMLQEVGAGCALRCRGIRMPFSGGAAPAHCDCTGFGHPARPARSNQSPLDEPTISPGSVSVRQQVLELLAELQRKYEMSYLFITHDLAVIRAMSHRMIVMKDGRVVESGPTEQLFESPTADYTQQLLASFRL